MRLNATIALFFALSTALIAQTFFGSVVGTVDDASGALYLEVNGRFRMGGTSSARSDHRQRMIP